LKTKVLFVINPIAGGNKKDRLPELIKQHLNLQKFEPVFMFTQGVNHAHKLASAAVRSYEMVVAVGGDGTINETGSAIAGTNLALGIIPCGSGNGLARFMGIPLNTVKAIQTLNNYQTQMIDGAQFNGKWFFNMAGMGFDAHISEVFAHHKGRGFGAYFTSSLKEIVNYSSQQYQITIDGRLYEREAFMLSFANSSQYGNNAHVSPHASVQDGLLDVCIIKPFPLYRFPEMGLRMFTRTADSSKYVEIIQGKHIEVKRMSAGPVHLDGEPQIVGPDAEIVIQPQVLKVVAGDGYQA
jgi:diacylglycerol kinase (ATP)